MDKELLDVIKKNLPSHVGETLRSELEALADLRGSHFALVVQYKELSASYADVKGRLHSQQLLDARDRHLDERQQAIETAEHNLKVTLAEAAVVEANKRADLAKELVATLFRGPVVMRSLSGSIPVPVEGMAPSQYNSGGSPGHVTQGPISTTETTTG